MGRSRSGASGSVHPITQRIDGRFRLMVVAETAVVATHVLPDAGTVSIGRDANNTIQIEDESISLHHAVLHVGRTITIEDLGSRSGTTVHDVAIPPRQPCSLGVNELVTLGKLTLILQARFAPLQTSRVATEEYYQTRVEEECARGERTAGQFSVVCIHISADVPDRGIVEALVTTLRQSDVLAKSGRGTYYLLLVETTPSQAEQVARRLVTSLQVVDAAATYVVAHFPTDGRSAYALLKQLAAHREVERDEIVVAEQSMKNLYALATRLAKSDLSVLMLGEAGVGKETMSRAMHQHSPRAAKSFVTINCLALDDDALESEMFGHERGAFAGATAVKSGLLEAASGGTVFLDEVGDLSLALQGKLLRVIEDSEVRRVGSDKPRKIDLRFIAATTSDLELAVANGRFREDLYIRLSAATLVIPPLRERPNELERLAGQFTNNASTRSNRQGKITAAATALLKAYSWPGNIRELSNVIERAVLLCGDGPIAPEHLPTERMSRTYVMAPVVETPSGEPIEKTRLLVALEAASGNQTKAASLLGVSRRTLINWIERYEIPRPRKRSDPDD